jgi:hypothetical protein
MAPGWVYDDPSTWSEKTITSADFYWTHDWCANYTAHPTPYFQARAYANWYAGGGVVDQTTSAYSQTLTGGFSEIYFSTDFCENLIANLQIFATGGSGGCSLSPGHGDYCSTPNCGPCAAGEGDCDSTSECQAGLTCVSDVGANYGWHPPSMCARAVLAAVP